MAQGMFPLNILHISIARVLSHIQRSIQFITYQWDTSRVHAHQTPNLPKRHELEHGLRKNNQIEHLVLTIGFVISFFNSADHAKSSHLQGLAVPTLPQLENPLLLLFVIEIR